MGDTSSGRTYDHPKFGKVQSVTTILSQTIPKQALVPWAAKVTAEEFVRIAEQNATKGAVSFTDVGPSKKWITIAELERLIPDAKAAHRKVGNDAANIGTEVHNCIEHKLLHNEFPPFTCREVELAVSEFDRFALEHELEVIELERVVFGHAPYAGRCDCICMLDGKKTLIDWKSSTKLHFPEYDIQLAAYAGALGIEHTGLVRLDKVTGALEYSDRSKYMDHCYEWFLTLVEATLMNAKYKELTAKPPKKVRAKK